MKESLLHLAVFSKIRSVGPLETDRHPCVIEIHEQLLKKSQAGDQSAAGALLEMHRERLRRMVQHRLQPCVAARVDVSDIVQETFVEASRKLPEYLRDRPVPFYCWLRRIAWERLVRLHEFHVRAAKRSVSREVDGWLKLTDHSSLMLVNCLAQAQLDAQPESDEGRAAASDPAGARTSCHRVTKKYSRCVTWSRCRQPRSRPHSESMHLPSTCVTCGRWPEYERSWMTRCRELNESSGNFEWEHGKRRARTRVLDTSIQI